MPISKAELLQKLDAAIAVRAAHDNVIGQRRLELLERVRQLVVTHGLPLPGEWKLEACAMPFIFQELNYDGYDWSRRDENFGQLDDIVEIDVIVWSGGRPRAELTADEFAEYHAFCHDAIRLRTRRR